MLLLFLDTETTGLNPDHHRAIEIAYKIVEHPSGKVLLSYESKIAISKEVWAAADPKSLAINGFIYEDLLAGQPEKVIAAQIIDDFTEVGLQSQGGVFICQNPSFDRGFFNKLISPEIQNQYQWPYHWLDLASMYWVYMIMAGQVVEREQALSKDSISRMFALPEEALPHRAMNGVNHLLHCYEELVKRIPKL